MQHLKFTFMDIKFSVIVNIQLRIHIYIILQDEKLYKNDIKCSSVWLLIKTEKLFHKKSRKKAGNVEFLSGGASAAVCIARFFLSLAFIGGIARQTSVGVFDDDGGKTHHGGKKQRGQHKTGGAVVKNYTKMRHKPLNKNYKVAKKT